MREALAEIGWVDKVLVNFRTSEAWPKGERNVEVVLDGHDRIWHALQNDNDEVPWEAVDLEPAEEAKVLATFDAIGRMAEIDMGLLKEVTEGFERSGGALDEMLDELLSLAPPERLIEPYHDEFDRQLAEMEGMIDEPIEIVVPRQYREQVMAWLANGEALTRPGIGKGVMRRCGLL